jgi:hypothetical protein
LFSTYFDFNVVDWQSRIMQRTILILFLIMALSTQVMAWDGKDTRSSDDLELLGLETPGCGNGGSNYLGEVTSYDPTEKNPDLTMEPMTSVNKDSNASKQRASQNTKADLHCIDNFERDGF